jgi:hypothetical protein
MLQLYGQTIIGMDATYKTTKWGFPLFLMNVVTNHGNGYPVALFLVQEETGDMIEEAIMILRGWNADWCPSFVMVNKSQQEMNAIQEAFDGQSEAMLCDFHRKQAWWRWLTTKDVADLTKEKRHLMFLSA